jgi:hypothetical protein
VNAIRDHHLPPQTSGICGGALVLQMAQVITQTWQIGRQEPVDLSADFDPEPHQDRFQQLGLPESKLPQLVWDIRQNLTGLERLYPAD